jgi:hypothetical protein
MQARNNDAEVTDLPIVGYFDVQRFKQFGPSDCANWTLMPTELGKKKVAAYPIMGRRHIREQNQNQLIFNTQPREIVKTVNYWYSIVGSQIFRIDKFFNQIEIAGQIGGLATFSGDIYFSYLITGTITFACFTDGAFIYVYREDTNTFYKVTDSLAPPFPTFIATFGNRIVASTLNSSQFSLSEINLMGADFDPAFVFHVGGATPADGTAVFAQESGYIRQFAVVQNTLFIMTDFKTGIWANIPSVFTSAGGVVTTFPWKKNTTTEWDFGIADPKSLDVDFDMIVFLAQNSNGLLQFMASESGGKPQKISTKAIDVLLQFNAAAKNANPFINSRVFGFLCEYENTIFYRASAGFFQDVGLLDLRTSADAIEFNFDSQKWSRAIEVNGERSRVQSHVFFANRHLVTVQADNTIYEYSGNFYSNELRNPAQKNAQAPDAYIRYPMRYERDTPNITIQNLKQIGYAEFETEYVEIDFVFGENPYNNVNAPFENTQFIIDEMPDASGNPVYMVSDSDPNTFIIADQGNTPTLDENTYYNWYKPHIELYWSDDGGISFHSADVMEFSNQGFYQWRMRWYELGTSRNRVYRLVCVSAYAITVLGGTMKVKRVSGGAD